MATKMELGGKIIKHVTYHGCHACDLKTSRDFRLYLRLQYN